MMDRAPKRFLKRINFIFAGILILGMLVSAVVFYFGNTIRDTTLKLVDSDLQSFTEFLDLKYALADQERYLYEYYASLESRAYVNNYLDAQNRSLTFIHALKSDFGHTERLKLLNNSHTQAKQIAHSVFENIEASQRFNSDTDWDLARKQLASFSRIKRDMITQVEALVTMTQEQVIASRSQIENNVINMEGFVIAYGIFTLLVAFLVGRALKAYLGTVAISQRLSLFPKRNPNPVISLDSDNQVTFCNPASRRLLGRLGLEATETKLLLSPDLKLQQTRVLASKDHFAKFEYAIKNVFLACELHWLPDQMQWDVHLTDITDKREAEQKLAFQAFHHPESCLANEYKFRQDLAESEQNNESFTVGFIEIRSFNRLLANATFAQTQQLIKELASVLDFSFHKISSAIKLYHIGDKNFAVYLTGDDCDQLVSDMVDEVNDAVDEYTFSTRQPLELDFGFACFPHHADSIDTLLNHCRLALNASARDETSKYLLFNHELGQLYQRQRELYTNMKSALESERFMLYFQPQLSLSNNKIIGAEVLIRWQENEQWISPGEFIPLAERSGFIVPLGNWILAQACRKTKQIIDLGYPDIVIAVNISPKQFNQPDFVEFVQKTLAEEGLAPKNLELEITEGVFFNNESDTIETLHRLKSMGVQLAIDDFGTGYSSLSYLKQFPIDKLKIDQSFVRHLDENCEDESIVRTVIELGKNLKLTLIAEGVEKQEQMEILRNMGCDELQGYWFSKPLDEGYFTYFLQNHVH